MNFILGILRKIACDVIVRRCQEKRRTTLINVWHVFVCCALLHIQHARMCIREQFRLESKRDSESAIERTYIYKLKQKTSGCLNINFVLSFSIFLALSLSLSLRLFIHSFFPFFVFNGICVSCFYSFGDFVTLLRARNMWLHNVMFSDAPLSNIHLIFLYKIAIIFLTV